MTDLWPWLALAGLGAYHGINPAMGWLFAVALGLHRNSRQTVYLALIPIALGHAVAIAVVLFAALALGSFLDELWLSRTAGLVLIGWAIYHARYGSRHRVRVGMRTGMAGLALWSFLMASAHGAGLMLLPVFMPMTHGSASHHTHGIDAGSSVLLALAAVGLHTFAMLALTGITAIVVYEWVGVAILRRGWLNLDLLWTLALFVTGLILLIF